MQIVYLSDSVLPSRTANSVHVMKMCQAFVTTGLEVILLAKTRGKKQSTEEWYRHYDINRRFKIKVFLVNNRLDSFIVSCFSYCRFVVKHYSKRNIVIYSRNIYAAAVLATLSYPIVFESHAVINNWFYNLAESILVKSTYCKLVIAITNNLKGELLEKYPLKKQHIEVLPDGADPVDVNEIKPIELKGSNDNMQIGYVGSLGRGKGLEIISKISHLIPTVNFHIVGGEPDQIEYWSGLSSGNVHFYGYQNQLDVKRYIKSFDIVLLPNQKTVYGAGKKYDIGKFTSPLKLFEYMALGKIIVSSDLPVLREVLNDELAILVDPQDVEGWVKAIKQIEADSQHYLTKAAKGICEIATKYSWENRAIKIQSFINDIT